LEALHFSGTLITVRYGMTVEDVVEDVVEQGVSANCFSLTQGVCTHGMRWKCDHP